MFDCSLATPPAISLAVGVLFPLGWSCGAGCAHLATRALAGATPVRVLPCRAALAVLWASLAPAVCYGGLDLRWLPVPVLVGWFGVALAACDLTVARLPDRLTFPVLVPLLAALCHWAVASQRGAALWGGLVGSLLFGGCYALVRLARPDVLGPGDVKLGCVLGLPVGVVDPLAVPAVILAAASLTLLAAVLTLRWRLPHGPAMLLPAWLVTAFPAPHLPAPPITGYLTG
ncbi:leader peptidase (prepilin peptidase) / N-methyltransferase [Actinopolyspora mzabensis]|uniref:Leader peptidase (Prepilin peptidase) / N-methyltransferase n=1 Tax=Actinopolyspora mzabensis TaxID=995066 RepID=A0A1G9BA21_ACTMZ|nr:prepilin peptidase [Actinopolyspora mzabensis]SDK36367.1 leader peptidase (prepilin peptidase) / N-methyltransferase [Actinopolyspora mzabensis]